MDNKLVTSSGCHTRTHQSVSYFQTRQQNTNSPNNNKRTGQMTDRTTNQPRIAKKNEAHQIQH
ncbi:hypothetical protein PILCRDRAFT_822322, partial [Piloderma croceum F 1598]